MSSKLTHSEADIIVEELNDGTRSITVIPKNERIYIHRTTCITTYPEDLIRFILSIKGPSYVCDEIMRDHDRYYLRTHLELTLCAHEDPQVFAGKRLLDFGCGSGASTVILAQLLPQTTILGVELEEDLLEIAKRRAEFYGLENVTFEKSPRGDKLPEALDAFDVIVLSAVYEHLLPKERASILPVLWSHLDDGGILFIDETPHRWFPVETHTTGLPLINYLPDRIALAYARHFSNRIPKSDSWESLLRKGVRGGAAQDILRRIEKNGGEASILKPIRLGIHDWTDLWFEGYAANASGRFSHLKRYSKIFFKAFSAITGILFVPYLSLAIKKNG